MKTEVIKVPLKQNTDNSAFAVIEGKGIKVQELINALKGIDNKNARIMFTFNDKSQDNLEFYLPYNFRGKTGYVDLKESIKRPARRIKEYWDDEDDDYDEDEDEELDKDSLIKEGQRAIRNIGAKEFASTVRWLWNNREDGGCAYWSLFDTNNFEYDLCLGWSDGLDPDDVDSSIYQEGEYSIQARFGKQPFDNYMQTDLDIDFDMPRKELDDDGDCFDNSIDISRKEDYEKLLKDFEKDVADLVNYIL